MRHIVRQTAHTACVVSLAALALAGCGSANSMTTSSLDSSTVVYPEGKYKLYGDGTVTPYYWVWIPNGATAPLSPPAPPALPARTVVVTQPSVVSPQIVTSPGGRYQLYGDGLNTPYYWAWIPSGVTPPPPPPLPVRP